MSHPNLIAFLIAALIGAVVGTVGGCILLIVQRQRTRKWNCGGSPEEGAWCWVSDGEFTWIAKREATAAGGWTNDDTWEDFTGDVKVWARLSPPPNFATRKGR